MRSNTQLGHVIRELDQLTEAGLTPPERASRLAAVWKAMQATVPDVPDLAADLLAGKITAEAAAKKLDQAAGAATRRAAVREILGDAWQPVMNAIAGELDSDAGLASAGDQLRPRFDAAAEVVHRLAPIIGHPVDHEDILDRGLATEYAELTAAVTELDKIKNLLGRWGGGVGQGIRAFVANTAVDGPGWAEWCAGHWVGVAAAGYTLRLQLPAPTGETDNNTDNPDDDPDLAA